MADLTATATQSKSSRIPELDALRALAAINLMLFHFTHVYVVKYGFTEPLGFEYPYGKYGVELFFMLSGLVNAMTILKKRKPDDFLASRFIRIFPSFLLVVSLNILLLGFSPLSETVNASTEQIMANFTVVPNLFGYECLEPVTWTLQIEVLFYAILLTFFVSGALEKPFIPLMWYMALCVAGTWYLDYFASSYGPSHRATTQWLHSAMLLRFLPLFSIGIFIQQIRFTDSPKWKNCLGIIISASVFHLIDNHDYNPLATVLMIGLMIASVYGKVTILRVRPLVFVSTISYSLYLLHNNLGSVFMYYLNHHFHVTPQICFALAIAFSVLVSTVATFWLEQPLSKLLRSIWKRFKTAFPTQVAEATTQTGVK